MSTPSVGITPAHALSKAANEPATIGEPLIRLSGRDKVMGKATFAAEFDLPNLAHAVMVTSTIANGTITRIDTTKAEKAAGVVTVITPANAPHLPNPAHRLSLLQTAEVHYNLQPIAVVVADSLNEATYAASLLDVRYQENPPQLDFEAGFGDARDSGGDKADEPTPAAFENAEVKVDQVYSTPLQNHNPMEPHATLASWEGDQLTLHDSTQAVFGDRATVAKVFGIKPENVRVICPFTGGGFGCKGQTWSHVLLAAMAAKVAKRPVRLVLQRPQMFGPVGGRAQTRQHIRLGAKRDGTLTAMLHDCYSNDAVVEDFTEHATALTRMLYACPVIKTSQKVVTLNAFPPTYMRAPGEAPGSFALEIAMDELAYALKMDPLALRLKNYAEQNPTTNQPWSSKHLRECYTNGAAQFGWSKRSPEPRSHREGHELIGYGMATATYPANRSFAAVIVRFKPDGRVDVICGTQDLGTGTYTIMGQTAAATLNLPIDLMDVSLGDTDQPVGPHSGGSQTAASVTPAVQEAAKQALQKLISAEVNNSSSPFHRAQPGELDFRDGKLFRKSAPSGAVHFKEILARSGNQPLEAKASTQPSQEADKYSKHSWGAVFAEVAVDETLGMHRVRKITAVYDVGTLLNKRTGHSQLIGGIVWAASLALFEDTVLDPHIGRPVKNNLAEYLVPVNLDIGEIHVSALNIPDINFNPLGARGIGEIGITGASAAVANAVFHATGKRIREAPITPDKLMA